MSQLHMYSLGSICHIVGSPCSLNVEEGRIDGKKGKRKEGRKEQRKKGFSLWLNILSKVSLSPKSLGVKG